MTDADFQLAYILAESPLLISVEGNIQELLGFHADDFLSHKVTWQSRVHAHDADLLEFLFDNNAIGSGSFTHRLRQANGFIRIFRLHYSKFITDGKTQLILKFQDAKKLYDTSNVLTANFKAMMENTDDFIFYKDRNHVFTGASQTLVPLCIDAQHWTDLLGLTDYDVFPEAFADAYYELEKTIFSGEKSIRKIQEFETKYGEKGWVDNRKYIIEDADGNVTGLFGIARDITQQKKTQEALLFRNFTLDRAQELIYWCDRQGRLIDINHSVCSHTGYSREELLSFNVSDIDQSMSEEKWREHWHSIKKVGSVTMEAEHKKRDGTFYPVEVVANYFEFEGEEYNCAFVRDITQRKQQVDALQEKEAQMGKLLRGLSSAVVVHSSDSHIIFNNQRAAEILGLSDNQMRGMSAIDPAWHFIDENSNTLKPEHYPVNRVLVTGKPFENLVIGVVKPDRLKPTWALTSGFPEFSQAGELQRVIISFHDISQRVEQEIELNKLNGQLSETMASMSHLQTMMERTEKLARLASYDWHVEENKVTWSPEMFQLFGRDPRLGVPNLEGQAQLYTPESSVKLYAAVDKSLQDGTPYELELIALRPDGEERPCVVMGFPERDETGRIAHLSGLVQDITDRKKAEKELRVAAIAFDSQEGMLVTDSKSVILKVNSAFTRITGYSSDDAIGQTPKLLRSGKHNGEFYDRFWQKLLDTGFWEGEIWNRRKNGDIYPQYSTVTAVKDSNGEVSNYVATFNDITLSKASAEEIKNLAFFDPLTNLPNRRLLFDRLQKRLSIQSRRGNNMGLIFLDLDNFKNLNDILGHDVGDLLLQQVAERLKSCVREGDTVARLGGDEFVVMLEDLSKSESDAASQAETIAKKILQELNNPYQLGIHVCSNTPSIGITLVRGKDQTLDELFKQADIAMYESKKAGRNTISFFDRTMQKNLKARFDLERDLNQAFDKDEFQLFLQIQVDSTNQPVGAEALIRWQNTERGLVTPIDFIPHAEESGQILKIGAWVMETAIKLLKTWQSDPLTEHLGLSVNVSARQFHKPSFASDIYELITKYDINATKLKIELTESLLLADLEDTISKMNDLNRMGIRLSLDDFGTGYSSLQYLKRLPLQQLKIDKSFVQDVESDSEDRAIVSTIIAMADSLGIEVIAEGVETEVQREFLIEKGCDRFQGYLFGKPIPIEQFLDSLKQNTTQVH